MNALIGASRWAIFISPSSALPTRELPNASEVKTRHRSRRRARKAALKVAIAANTAMAYAAPEKKTPPRLLTKNQVLARIGVTFPTVWAWMRAGEFPRAVVVGNKSMWHEQEINAWITALPRRDLKGDGTEEVCIKNPRRFAGAGGYSFGVSIQNKRTEE